MKKKNSTEKRGLREEMLRQKFYNEKPIRGYNHLIGTLDAKIMPGSQGLHEYNVNPEARSLRESEY